MRGINLKTIVIGLLFLLYISLIALGMVSCGARKTDKQVSKEQTESKVVDNSVTEKQSESNVKENVVIKIDDKNKTVTEETTYSPEDPTKEAFIIEKDGTKVILNNSKKTYKKTTQDNNTQSEIKSDSETKQKEAVKGKKAIKASVSTEVVKKSSKTEREEISMWNWVWLLIPIVAIIWLLRKYKDKIWWF